MSAQTWTARRVASAAAGVLATVMLLAACGGGSSTTTSGSSGNSSKQTPAASTQTVATGTTPVGTVLVDSKGMTLYAFAADSPGKSNCTGSCLSYWPPVHVSGSLSHSSDVTGKLGTIKRSDGTTQLTVNGWPMYNYVSDSSPGQASGQGLNLSGGNWWVVSPSGAQIKSGGGSGGGSSSSGGAHGY
jgi:predicted lipoprotein with Yx(FWY)xxD motif